MDLLKRFGYPAEGIVQVSHDGGPDAVDYPQERFSAMVCKWCRFYCEDECTKGKTVEDPDIDTCDDIDYIDEWLEDLRYPVRSEYSSDKTYQQACKAIRKIRAEQEAEEEHEWNLRHYGPRYWEG